MSVLFSPDCTCSWFEASASVFMVWSPFHFTGTIRISVGVQFHLDLWIVHIRILAEICASLYLEVPPFSGSAFVDLHCFTIHFGNPCWSPRPSRVLVFVDTMSNHANAADQGSQSGLVLGVMRTMTHLRLLPPTISLTRAVQRFETWR